MFKTAIVNNKNIALQLLLLMLFCTSQHAMAALQSIDITDNKIRVLGTNYVYHENQQLSFTRHSKATLSLPKKRLNFNIEKAQSTSGIAIEFATNSNTINLQFVPTAPINRGSEFALYENGKQVKTYKFNPKHTQLNINYASSLSAEYVEYKLSLPSFANVALTQLSINDSATLLPLKSSRKAKYVAIGDSITHGVGQGSASYLTYPYLVADALDLELFNLAVGGGKASVPTAEMLKDINDIELITILIGYNDWNAANADVNKYAQTIDTMLTKIRQYHPSSQVYFITPLYTKREQAKHTKLPIQAYRDAVIQTVRKRIQSGDQHIALIHGDSITSAKNLREDQPKDPVHLGINGANMFAQQLIAILQK